MGFFRISSKQIADKAKRVSPAGIESKELMTQLTQKKHKPTKSPWRVLTLESGQQFVTRKNYSPLTRWLMGIRDSNETDACLVKQRRTADFLHQQLGGQDLAAAQAYFSTLNKVKDTVEFRQHNQTLATAQARLWQRLDDAANARAAEAREQDIRERVVPMVERRIAAMHQNRADLMRFQPEQLQQLPELSIGDELALELNSLVGQPLEMGVPLNEQQAAVLRRHVDGTSDKSRTTVNKTIESMLLRLPTARLLHESVFLALVDYYQDWSEQYLRAQIQGS